MSAAVRPPDVIELERLRLRRPTLADAPAVFEYASDPEVARYADWPISASLESVAERLQSREAEWNAGAEFHWVATLPPEDRAIGAIACAISGHTAEFGFLFAQVLAQWIRDGSCARNRRLDLLGAFGVAVGGDLRYREPRFRSSA